MNGPFPKVELLHMILLRRRAQQTFADANGLLEFIKHFWHVLEPQTKFQDGWVLRAMCDHLQAVSRGEINRLLINVPPGFMKSLLVDVFWPAWEWAIIGSHLRYVTFSYSAGITERDNDKFCLLVSSREYQDLFGDRVKMRQIGIKKVSNEATGWKLASSVGGVGTGERGDRIVLDDPHNVKETESEIVRNETVRWFRESMSNRLNDMKTGAIVVIMQRVHFEDVSGVILEKGMDYVHLMVPMEYEYDRMTDEDFEPLMNAYGWYDPRYDEYDPHHPQPLLAWPERFSPEILESMYRDMGPYAVAGQYQQSPVPRGGGIFKREWWQVYDHPEKKYPLMDYVVASLDAAFTSKERNDPSALTVWGLFKDKEDQTRVMLIRAWRKHLPFSGDAKKLEPLRGESKTMWAHRTQPDWGLIEWLRYTCEICKVDKLLIEAKGPGISAAQYIEAEYGRQAWSIELCQVKGDKEARALAVQPEFARGMVYAPVWDWSELVIEEMESFPMHKYDDITDSATQAIKYLRDTGMLLSDAEVRARAADLVMHTGKKRELNFW